MKSFQLLLLLHDKKNRINLQQKAFSVIAAKIQKFDWLKHYPSVSEVKTGALLASEGYLTSLANMRICNLDITDIPQHQKEKLLSIVKEEVMIDNMTPLSQLRIILNSVQCQELFLMNMELSEADTRALVTTMRNRVKRVRVLGVISIDNVKEEVMIDDITPHSQLRIILNSVECQKLFLKNMELSETDTRALVIAMRDRVERVTLGVISMDIEEFTKYDGQGRCRWLWFGVAMRTRHKDRLRCWAEGVGWTETETNFPKNLFLHRKKKKSFVVFDIS